MENEQKMPLSRSLRRLARKSIDMMLACIWVATKYHAFRAHLNAHYGISNISLFRVSSWHMGCCYLIGTDKRTGQPLFIKTNGAFRLAEREGLILDRLYCSLEKNDVCVPRPFAFSGDRRFGFVASEFAKGETLLSWINSRDDIDANKKQGIASGVANVVSLLRRNRVVHCDLHLDNIMIDDQGNTLQLTLIDFGMAFCEGIPEPEVSGETALKLYKALGHFKPADYVWDDAFSAEMIIEKLGLSDTARGCTPVPNESKGAGELACAFLPSSGRRSLIHPSTSQRSNHSTNVETTVALAGNDPRA